jgi:hypothetical protein
LDAVGRGFRPQRASWTRRFLEFFTSPITAFYQELTTKLCKRPRLRYCCTQRTAPPRKPLA